jgi:hypothetical protein
LSSEDELNYFGLWRRIFCNGVKSIRECSSAIQETIKQFLSHIGYKFQDYHPTVLNRGGIYTKKATHKKSIFKTVFTCLGKKCNSCILVFVVWYADSSTPGLPRLFYEVKEISHTVYFGLTRLSMTHVPAIICNAPHV